MSYKTGITFKSCFEVLIINWFVVSLDLRLVRIEPREEWLKNLFVKLGLMAINDLLNDLFLDEDTSDEYLMSLDPKDWKHQDHYRILNIKNRFFASADEIKKQCIYWQLFCQTVIIELLLLCCFQIGLKYFDTTRTRGLQLLERS